MAGNSNSGIKLTFPLSAEELEQAIQQYKADYYDGKFLRPTGEHFLSRCGATIEQSRAVFESEKKNNSTYKIHADLLRKLYAWMRGELLSNVSGNGTALVKFVLAQDLGDGVVYTDDPKPQQQTLSITFGDGDSRAAGAGK